jgi:cytochrome oxidase Cu insertion factor (SCO1/SenC/PrrC family)/tetratricopeptide (TPR) repeat protein
MHVKRRLIVFLLILSAWSQQPSAHFGLILSATRTDAEKISKELAAGADFGVLAKEKSIDPSARDGGYLGGSPLPPELEGVAKALRPGQFGPVVQTATGFAILTRFAKPPATGDLDAERIRTLASRGAVRDTIDISGMASANAAFAAYPDKPAGWEHDPGKVCAVRTNSYNAAVNRLSRQLPEADAQPSGKVRPIDLLHGHAVLALLYVYTGDMDQSIAEWDKAYQIAQASVPDSLPYVQEALGVTHLHLAEMENGVYRKPGDQGLFPPAQTAQPFARPEHAKLAVDYFTKVLKAQPENLEVKWLLNLADLMLGQQAPAADRIPLSRFDSKETIGRFRDIAPALGLDVFTGAGGVIADDFDGDGLLDVVTSSMDMCEPLHFFHNNGNGTFSDRTAQAGLSNQLGGLNIVHADYNNDGCVDLLVLRGGWEAAQRKSLLRNNCNGTFTDVTESSGLGQSITSTQTAVFADIDNDGFLDLFIGNENSPSQLFRNRGDGTFEDISHAAGVDKTAFSKGVTAADYDNDGYVDLYVSNVTGANFLYHNKHDGTFTEIGRQAGVQAPYFSFATWFFDYDNDGWPDLFVNCYYSSMEEVIRSALGLPFSSETLKLYRNLHNGAFEDVTAKVGLDKVFMPMGANFGDVDNDGYLDIYLGEGQPSLASLMPHILLRNKEGKSFADITASSGTGDIHKGHGIVFADLERTGHEDILAGMGGAVPSDKHSMRVYHNPGNENDWLDVRLTGVKTNRAGVGARIQVTLVDRSIYRTVGETSSFGGNPVEQHIGLGRNAQIKALDVWWPASNTRQHFTKVAKNQVLTIREFQDASHAAKGIVLKTDAARHTMTVSCEAIPGYMEAMAMDFKTREDVKPGTVISFTLLEGGGTLYAEDIKEGSAAPFEAEPMAAAQLTALNNALDPAQKPLAAGDAVPNFTLTDQAGQRIRLSQFQGKVVALTFGYSRCPNPNYCYRLSNNLAQIDKRFKDVVLMTIMLDPEHDQGTTLAEYAKVFHADPARWHFLTGPLPEIKNICSRFGVNFWSVEGLLTHTLHTVVIDRQGRVAVNLEGNQFTARQLGDLVQSVVERP